MFTLKFIRDHFSSLFILLLHHSLKIPCVCLLNVNGTCFMIFHFFGGIKRLFRYSFQRMNLYPRSEIFRELYNRLLLNSKTVKDIVREY